MPVMALGGIRRFQVAEQATRRDGTCPRHAVDRCHRFTWRRRASDAARLASGRTILRAFTRSDS